MCLFCKGVVCIFLCFCVSLDHFGFVLLVMLLLVFYVPSQEIGRLERLGNDRVCVEWEVKPCCIRPYLALPSAHAQLQRESSSGIHRKKTMHIVVGLEQKGAG